MNLIGMFYLLTEGTSRREGIQFSSDHAIILSKPLLSTVDSANDIITLASL